MIFASLALLSLVSAASGADGPPFNWYRDEVAPIACPQRGDECLERARKMLREELAKPVPERVGPACPAPVSETCPPGRLDECVPKAAAPLFVLANFEALEDRDRAKFVPEYLLAAKSPDPMVHWFGIDALAASNSVEALPFLKRELNSGRPSCQMAAAGLMRGTFAEVAKPLAPDLVPLLGFEDWFDRSWVVKLLANFADPRTDPALEAQLGTPPFTIQLEAARGLGRMGKAAISAVPALKKLATTHWSPALRREAAAAVKTIAGVNLAPRPAKCEAPPRSQAGIWEGTVDGAPVRLVPLGEPEVSLSKACASPIFREHMRFAKPIDGACIIGTNRGEFGGELDVVSGEGSQSLQRAWWGNPIQFVQASDQIWVIEGIAHLSLDLGVLVRLTRSADGAWRAQAVDALPGEPLASGHDHRGNLLILTSDRHSVCGEKSAVSLLRATANGIESLP